MACPKIDHRNIITPNPQRMQRPTRPSPYKNLFYDNSWLLNILPDRNIKLLPLIITNNVSNNKLKNMFFFCIYTIYIQFVCNVSFKHYKECTI